jgi:hypothetical protein
MGPAGLAIADPAASIAVIVAKRIVFFMGDVLSRFL